MMQQSKVRSTQNSLSPMVVAVLAFFAGCIAPTATANPDIATVKPDLVVPALSEGEPAAGKRVKQTLPAWARTDVYHVLYLPRDYLPIKERATSERGDKPLLPVIIELAGNGPYRNRFGDVSTGHPEGSKLGYGITAGKGCIWLCLPYLNAKGDANVTQWWGNKPGYDPGPTLAYIKAAVPWVCERYGGDPKRVVLAGFSRGAIACNALGLADDEVARLWAGFIAYSHYDGVRRWPWQSRDGKQASAKSFARLRRLGDRPQFICHEGAGVEATRRYLEGAAKQMHAGNEQTKPATDATRAAFMKRFTFAPTGFRNHNDAWVLRPSPARTRLRAWFAALIGKEKEGEVDPPRPRGDADGLKR